MAVKTQDMLTPEQLNDNYEYKVSKKIVMREFPWVKDISFDGDKINDYNLIFITLHMDPFELSNITGWPVSKWAIRDIEEGNRYWSPYLSTMMNISYEDAKPITKQIDDTLSSVHKSPAIPKDLRLPADRRLSIGNFTTQQGLTVPTSYVDWHKTLKD
jgi:hypothetical protein